MARKPAYGPVPFGDCLTGHHKRCMVSYVDDRGRTKTCPCQCEEHGIEHKPAPPPSALLLEMLEKHYGSKY